MKPSEAIKMAQMCARSDLERWLIAGPEDEPLYMLKPRAMYWLMWINKKILYELPGMDYRTVGVRLRIATSMLNGLEQANVLSKEICIKYHERLISNVNRLVCLLQAEDLPF